MFTTAVIYPTGICNLNCRYCGINKNPALKDIDQMLGDSFEGDYYFNQIKKYFPRKDMLKSVETWGGEPFIHMDRVYNLVDQLINYYPYFDTMFSSTNFSYDIWIDKFFGLMDVFGKYPYRDFHYCLQLSVDGPKEINDVSRGEGVTEKCLNIFNQLVKELQNNRLPTNVHLIIQQKGTLDCETTKTLLSRQKIIDYFKFYEDNFIAPIKDLNLSNVETVCGIPNTAVPSPVTVEDGKIFAEFVKLCREIEKENHFKYYKEITPFSNDVFINDLTLVSGYHTCGVGESTIGFLPNNILSTCHEGFVQIVESYEKYAAQDDNAKKSITFDKFLSEQKVPLCTTEESYKTFIYKMSTYNKENATAMLTSNISMITALAMAGQIEERYLREDWAIWAGIFIQEHTSYCIKDNYNKTGSYTTQPVGLYKLLLNGAAQYIQRGE